MLHGTAPEAWPSGFVVLHISLATGQTQPNNPNRHARMQLPVDASDYATCMSLLLSKSASRGSHVNSLSV